MINYRRQPIGKKSLVKFKPHSLLDFKEITDNDIARLLLTHVNLFYLKYFQVPPVDYLTFVIKQGFNSEDIKKGINYLAHHGWFEVTQNKKVYSYSISSKFKKAFYHFCGRGPK